MAAAQPTPPVDELLEVAAEAARAAGALLLERFRAGTERVLATKTSPTDLVSEADLEAERVIRGVIHARRPADAVLGEEGAKGVARARLPAGSSIRSTGRSTSFLAFPCGA